MRNLFPFFFSFLLFLIEFIQSSKNLSLISWADVCRLFLDWKFKLFPSSFSFHGERNVFSTIRDQESAEKEEGRKKTCNRTNSICDYGKIIIFLRTSSRSVFSFHVDENLENPRVFCLQFNAFRRLHEMMSE